MVAGRLLQIVAERREREQAVGVEGRLDGMELVELQGFELDAHLIDLLHAHAVLTGVLGTIAGDDTLMIVAAAEVGGEAIATRIEEMGARR